MERMELSGLPQAMHSLLGRFLSGHARLGLCLLSRELTILAANDGFMQLVDETEGPAGLSLLEYLPPDELPPDLLAPPGDDRGTVRSGPTMVRLRRKAGGTRSCRISFWSSSNHVMVALEERLHDVEETLNALTSLNNEFANITRQLAKKTRELELANERIEALTRTDSLTGLPNRRAALAHLGNELSRMGGNGDALVVAFVDLDHFKQVNDRYGHDAGDEVLVGFSRCTASLLRTDDLVARLGGEEFLVFLRGVDCKGAVRLLEGLRRELRALEFRLSTWVLTASFGVYPVRPGDSGTTVIRRADGACYRAKRTGRDRVVCWDAALDAEPTEGGSG